MREVLLKHMVRLRFQATSRRRADAFIEQSVLGYRELTTLFSIERGRKKVNVPPIRGVDEEMRGWSFYMILEHNVIVNEMVRRVVNSLGKGAFLKTDFDPKHDVMPGVNPGPELVDVFFESVKNYQKTVSTFPKLRGTITRQHPVFDRLDAHGWHCMFGLHLEIHRKQAEAVARLA